jgi:hypothetical protein
VEESHPAIPFAQTLRDAGWLAQPGDAVIVTGALDAAS